MNATPAQMLTLLTHDGQPFEYPRPKAHSTFNLSTGAGISWAMWSWNPITGCLHGCPYCYAREIALSARAAKFYPAGFAPLFHSERLAAPLHTRVPAAHQDDPAWWRVFVGSMADNYNPDSRSRRNTGTGKPAAAGAASNRKGSSCTGSTSPSSPRSPRASSRAAW